MISTHAKTNMNHLQTFVNLVLREYLSTGYGLRFSTQTYRSKREKTFFHESLQEYCFVLTEISGNLREFTG